MLTDTHLKSKVDALWARLWSGGIANPLTAIEQMSYLIFLKRLENRDNAQKKSAERRGQTHKSVFAGKKDCRWSYWMFSTFHRAESNGPNHEITCRSYGA
jgi:type I restriction enzyme M protein